ncbi:ATP synthase F1 subunit delta [Candidatus Cardinium sp. TP]|uniref:ATP synthase F1 subunit delta n=1 Tax=Candidatus Cardinium sp. TP TaxID=2961955 RepID=UPI0021B0258C|nr:ATP synthase F1 subunit delta [Candidatus Cardinium sp. TP]MCT4697475.1 ATP synthase F1 subunit delta [Candidatus Cardinium sp. TP]
MFKNKKIAARYASVFLAQAIQSGIVKRIHSDLSFLHHQFREHPILDNILNNPTIPHAGKRKLLQTIGNEVLSPMVWRLLEILIDQHQIGLLKEILTAFSVAYHHHMGIQFALVTTAVALPEALIKKLVEEVKRWVPCKEVRMKQQIDLSIIGGYILQIGGLKLDKSIKHGLQALQSVLH